MKKIVTVLFSALSVLAVVSTSTPSQASDTQALEECKRVCTVKWERRFHACADQSCRNAVEADADSCNKDCDRSYGIN